MSDAVSLLDDERVSAMWHETLTGISKNKNAAPAVAGYATRLLSDAKIITGEELVQVFYFSTSVAQTPGVAAAWL